LRWIHLAFTDSFLETHKIWGGEIPGGEDQYILEWGETAKLLGLMDPPRNKKLTEQMNLIQPNLTSFVTVKEALRFLLNPPLPFFARPFYAIVTVAAVSTLGKEERKMLGLPPIPSWPAKIMIRILFFAMKHLVGKRSPIQVASMKRVARLEKEKEI
jgi:uncharacterized protein (DUF2236 family)